MTPDSAPDNLPDTVERHQISRIRRELRRRRITVARTEAISPNMRRVTFTSPDLADFESAGHDDHVKIAFPSIDGSDEPTRRDFTPRRFDAASRELAIDFALHDAGAAAVWARQAKPGDTLEMGGPRGSTIVADDFDWYLFVGDESALPAIGRRVEELRAGVPVSTLVIVENAGEEQVFDTLAAWRPHWVHRQGTPMDDAAALVAALAGLPPERGDGFAWVAGETSVARAVRRHLLDERRHPAAWLKAAAYWTRGVAGAHEKLEGE